MMLHCSYITTSPSVYQISFYYHTTSERSACKARIFHVATSFADIDQFCGLWDKAQHLQAKQLEKHSHTHTQLMQYRYTFHWLHMVVKPTRLETKCTLNWENLSEMDTSEEKKTYSLLEHLIPLLLPLCSQASSGIKLSCSTTSAACETALVNYCSLRACNKETNCRGSRYKSHKGLVASNLLRASTSSQWTT